MPDPAQHSRPRRPFQIEAAREIIAELKALDGALMPILHALQDEFGYIDPATEPLIADFLNITRAEVHGVVTFYRDFRRAPDARHSLLLCRAEACQARGGDALAAEVEAGLGVPINSTTPDGRVRFEAVYCLGLCASGPAAVLDGRLIGRVHAGGGGDRLVKACET
jgi:formate dehydrogenase subunit gamma